MNEKKTRGVGREQKHSIEQSTRLAVDLFWSINYSNSFATLVELRRGNSFPMQVGIENSVIDYFDVFLSVHAVCVFAYSRPSSSSEAWLHDDDSHTWYNLSKTRLPTSYVTRGRFCPTTNRWLRNHCQTRVAYCEQQPTCTKMVVMEKIGNQQQRIMPGSAPSRSLDWLVSPNRAFLDVLIRTRVRVLFSVVCLPLVSF